MEKELKINNDTEKIVKALILKDKQILLNRRARLLSQLRNFWPTNAEEQEEMHQIKLEIDRIEEDMCDL